MIAETCPIWGCDLRGEPIPQEYLDRGLYGTTTHYSRTIGHVEHGIYDGVVFWSCPECGGAWHRWPEGSKIRELAQPLVDAVNAAAVVR